jgi:non-specific serine/threonine protein kinase
VTLTREQFESMISTPLAETTKALRRALQGAGVQPAEIKKVLLVGGSSRIPLVAEMVSAELGRPVAVDLHPKHSVAFGAGIAAGAALKAASVSSDAPALGTPPPEPPTAASASPPAGAPPPREAEAAEPGPSPPGSAEGRRRLLAGAGIAALVAIVIAVIVLAGGGDDSDPETTAAQTTTSTPTTTATTTPPATGSLVPGEWREVGEAPTARQQVATASLKGQIFVVGGLTESGATTKVEAFDPFISAWRDAPALPVALHHAMAVSYRGELVVIGGWTPEGADLTAVTSADVYALRDNEWVELEPLPEPRAAGAATVVGDEIVVVGGQDATGELVQSTEVFDGESWRSGAPIPTQREHLAAASDGSYAYAVGGRQLSSEANSDALERYDPQSDSWEQLPPMPTARGSLGGAAVIKDDGLIVVGGEEPTTVLGTVEVFDISEQAWSPAPELPTARHGAGIARIGTTVFVIGGATQPGHSASSNAVEALEFSVEK